MTNKGEIMAKAKEPGKRERIRALKLSIRAEISGLQQRIAAALNAPRVPDRIVNGDAHSAIMWKAAMEKGDDAAYHIKYEPSPKLTAEKLSAIKARLSRVLAEIT